MPGGSLGPTGPPIKMRSQALLILERSRAAKDLTEDDEQYIVQVLNDSWDKPKPGHFCPVGRCPLGCNGDKKGSQAHESCAFASV